MTEKSLVRDLQQEIARREKALQAELAPIRKAIATLAPADEQGEERPAPRRRKRAKAGEAITPEQVRAVIEERFGDGRWFRSTELSEAVGGNVNTSTLRTRVMALLEEGVVESNGERGRGAALRYAGHAGEALDAEGDAEPQDEAA